MKSHRIHLAKVIRQLRSEGFHATAGRIRGAIKNGYLKPTPKRDSNGAFMYDHKHIDQLRRYFVNIRPGPRPQNPVKFEIVGSMDRMHRLARKRQAKAAKDVKRKNTDVSLHWLQSSLRINERSEPDDAS